MAATEAPSHTTIEVPQRQPEVSEVGGSELGASSRMAVGSDDIENEEDTVEKDAVEKDELQVEPGISILYQPGAGEAEHTFASVGPEDVALDMDTEIAYITKEESNEGSDDDLDDSMY